MAFCLQIGSSSYVLFYFYMMMDIKIYFLLFALILYDVITYILIVLRCFFHMHGKLSCFFVFAFMVFFK